MRFSLIGISRLLRFAGPLCLVSCLIPTTPGAFAQDPAAASPAQTRDDGQIVYLGDSRLAAQFEDPDQHVQNARFFGNVATQLLGQRLVTAGNFSASGFRSDQYLTEDAVERTIATRARWVAIFGIVNDIGQLGPLDAFDGDGVKSLKGGIKAKLDRFLEASMRPILVLEPGADQFAADPARTASVAAYNAAARRYADAHPEVVVFDLPGATLETAPPARFRPGYALDGIHLSNLGGAAAGQAFADLMRPLLAKAPSPLEGRKEAGNMIGLASSVAPGAVKAPVTGTVPSGWFAMCTPGVSAVVGETPVDGEPGIRLEMKAEAAGDCTLGRDMTGEEAGRRYEEFAEVRIEANAAGFAGPYLQLQANRGGRAADVFDNFASVSGPGPSEARHLVLRTPALTVPQKGERAWFTTRLGARFTGPGAAVVTFSRAYVGETAAP